MSKPIVRIAPSPTGNLHIGTARTALFNYLYAHKMGGQFLVRIEDTDKARSTKEFEQNILDGLKALGLNHDDEITHQSKRTDLYKQKLEQLLKEGKAYISQETEGESKEVIRLKNPGTQITFKDLIKGEITFDTTELKDFVIAKNLEEPLYHLAVVIDDAEMGVTHVIRGEDHISNTPRQILIQEALGYQRPEYAHIPLILAPDRSKLSKRHGATGVGEYLSQGYLPAALVNFMALLGWSPQAGEQGTDEEVFSLAELVERFSLEAVQTSGAIFNLEKLNWLNREHLRRLPAQEQTDYVLTALPNKNPDVIAKITSLIIDKASNWDEIKKMDEAGELSYFFTAPNPSKELLKTTAHLPKVVELLEKIDAKDWNAENIKAAIWDFASDVGRGDVLWPMRVALSGREKSPDPFTLAAILGKGETVRRLNRWKMTSYRHKQIKEEVEIGKLANSLLDEIDNIYKPFIESHNFLDAFNPVRILMPLIETSSKIEVHNPKGLLKKLDVPEPELIWLMFRNGLSHHIRPFYLQVNGKRISWAVSHSPNEHYQTEHNVGISPKKLLEDLRKYLVNFLGNTNKIKIQTGLKLIKNIK